MDSREQRQKSALCVCVSICIIWVSVDTWGQFAIPVAAQSRVNIYSLCPVLSRIQQDGVGLKRRPKKTGTKNVTLTATADLSQ